MNQHISNPALQQRRVSEAKKEIKKAFQESTLGYWHDGQRTGFVISQEWDLAESIWQIEAVTLRITRTNGTLFLAKSGKNLRTSRLHCTRLGQAVLNCLKSDFDGIRRHFPVHEFNPYVNLFVRNMLNDKVDDQVALAAACNKEELIKLVERLNAFVDAIRLEGNSAEFKQVLKNHASSPKKNFRLLLKYIDSLFLNYSRLLVLRVDLGYFKGCSYSFHSVHPDEINQHREKLVRALRTALPKGCYVGYVLKLEYGLEKGFHFHLMLFLDGSRVRQDITIAKFIGEEIWHKKITRGMGQYFNCNAMKEGYKSCGIGMINHSDALMRANLKKAALYLTKTDYYVRIYSSDKKRTYWRGINLKSRTERRGRPRTNSRIKQPRSVAPYLTGQI